MSRQICGVCMCPLDETGCGCTDVEENNTVAWLLSAVELQEAINQATQLISARGFYLKNDQPDFLRKLTTYLDTLREIQLTRALKEKQ